MIEAVIEQPCVVQFDPSEKDKTARSVQRRERGKRPEAAFRIVPATLRQAMFLQFWQAYEGNKEHVQCHADGCDEWFEQSEKSKGRKVFCSQACKAKDYRNRKHDAIDLREQNRTPAQIAQETGTPLETIKKWLKQNPKQKDS